MSIKSRRIQTWKSKRLLKEAGNAGPFPGREPCGPRGGERLQGGWTQPRTHRFCPGEKHNPEPHCTLGFLGTNKAQPITKPTPAHRHLSAVTHPGMKEHPEEPAPSKGAAPQSRGWGTATRPATQGSSGLQDAVCGASRGLGSARGGTCCGEKLALMGPLPCPRLCAAPFPPEVTHAATAESTPHPEPPTHRAAASEGRAAAAGEDRSIFNDRRVS